jgi:putative sugar O-methyltransferase
MHQVVGVARKNLEKSIASMGRSKLPPVGARWGAYSEQIRELAKSTNDPLLVIRTAQEWQGSFESRHQADALAAYAADLDNLILDEFPEYAQHLASFSESDTAPSDKIVFRNGRKVSSPILSQTRTVLRGIKTACPEVVLDIGGGTGSTGRLWLVNTAHNPRRYIDLDLPESLFFAEVYLRHHLPNVNVIYVHSVVDLLRCNLICSGPQVVLIPAHNYHLARWLGIDIVTNTGSLQEMTTEFVEHYMRVIDSSGAKYFYSSNYFAQKIEVLVESMNYAAPVLPPYWQATYMKWWHDDFRGVAEMAFERMERPSTETDTLITPTNPAEFLCLFDALRSCTNGAVIADAIVRTRESLAYVPKELLFLARRAASLEPSNNSIARLRTELEQLAAAGAPNFGMVGEPLRSL